MARRRNPLDGGVGGSDGGSQIESIAGSVGGAGNENNGAYNGTGGNQGAADTGTGAATDASTTTGTGAETSSAGISLNPADVAGEAKPKRKYTRRAGAAAEEAPRGLKATEVRDKVQGFHFIAAMMTGSPLFMLTDDEIDAITARVVEVSKHYDLSVVSGKYAALAMLGGTCASIYGRKIMVLRAQAAAMAQEQPEPATVFDADPSHVVNGGIDLTRDTMTGKPI